MSLVRGERATFRRGRLQRQGRAEHRDEAEQHGVGDAREEVVAGRHEDLWAPREAEPRRLPRLFASA